jgi:hypothetical protein
MSALAMSFAEERREERVGCRDLETISFRLEHQELQHVSIHAIVQDKSNSGLGCYCAPSEYLQVGVFLNLWDLMVYEVRWLQHVTGNIVNIGLLLVREKD